MSDTQFLLLQVAVNVEGFSKLNIDESTVCVPN